MVYNLLQVQEAASIRDDFDRTAIGTHNSRASVVAAWNINSPRTRKTSIIRKAKAERRSTRAREGPPTANAVRRQ